MCSKLRTGESAKTYPEAYYRFISSLAVSFQDTTVAKYSRTKLTLYHPRGPFPNQMLTFLQSCVREQWNKSGPFIDDVLNPTNIVGANLLYWESLRAAQALHAAARRNDARWILDILFQRTRTRMSTGKSSFPTAASLYLPRNSTDRERASAIYLRAREWTSLSPSERSTRRVGGV